MELNHLKSFYEVAKDGSFTAAARRLRISQSALSKAVALLEDHEGVLLFERSKKGVTLTPLGGEVYLKAERLFQTLTEIEVLCRGTKETCKGPLRFGASDHVINYLLIKKIQHLRRSYPEVIPSLFSGTPNDIVELILRNEIEFGLFFTKVNVPGIQYESLFPLGMAIVCAPHLIPDIQKTVTPARLKKILQEVGYIGSIQTQYQNHPSREFMKFLGKDPRIAYESNNQETQKRLCLEGAGVAYLARMMIEEEVREGRLVEIPLSQPISPQLVLASRKGRRLSLNARTFLNLLTGSSK